MIKRSQKFKQLQDHLCRENNHKYHLVVRTKMNNYFQMNKNLINKLNKKEENIKNKIKTKIIKIK